MLFGREKGSLSQLSTNNSINWSFGHSIFKMRYIQLNQINLTLHVVCFAIVVAYAIINYCNFVRNDDLCEVSFKNFHSEIDAPYPSLTMCLMSPIVQERLSAHSGTINISSYESYLMGKTHDVASQAINIPYDNVSIQATDFILRADVNPKRFGKRYKIEKIITQSHRFMNGIMKCFTFDVPYVKGEVMNAMNIVFSNVIFPNGILPSDGWKSGGIQLFLHYPKQFLRSFSSNKRFWAVTNSTNNLRARLYLKGMEVLTKRHKKGIEDCQDGVPYDDWTAQQIMDKVGCRPPHWAFAGDISLCTKKEELRRIGELFWDIFYGTMRNESITPCTEIRKLDLEHEETEDATVKENQTRISLHFIGNSYKEIRQMRAYTLLMLVGNVGGFVGLLLGYAFVQIPGSVYATYCFFKGKLTNMTKPRNTVKSIQMKIKNQHDEEILNTLQKNFEEIKCVIQTLNHRIDAIMEQRG